MTFRTACVLLAALAFAACSDDSPVTPAPPAGAAGVYVLNEGNFQRGNATLSWYVPDSGRVYPDVFRAVNGRDLGDTGNSITLHDGRAWLVINGSNRIEVIDVRTHAHVRTIECPPGSSPRHIAFDAAGRGYITNLYANSVSLYDDATGTITGAIATGANPEGLAAVGGRVFVANSGFGAERTVTVIDGASRTVLATLSVGDNPTAVAALGASRVAVLCTGAYNDFNDPADDTPGRLFIIDAASLTVVDSMTLGGHPQRLAVEHADRLYTVQSDGIHRITPSTRAAERIIPGSFYGVEVDATRGVLYATEPVDFVQSGRLAVYGLDGARRSEHAVGVIPGAIAIVR